MRNWFLYILFLLSVTSCERKTDWDLQLTTDNRLVVDALVTNERKAHFVKLSKPPTELNGKATPVSGAIVKVTAKDSVNWFTETPPGSGIYLSDSALQGVVGLQYKLTIEHEGNTYTATTSMVSVTPFQPLTYSLDESKGLYKVTHINNPYTTRPAMYKVYLQWSHVSGSDTLDLDSTSALLTSYAFNTIDVGQIFAPDAEQVLFPAYTIITEKKFSLAPDYAAFLRALVLETRWHGGYFDEAVANLPTNLSEGAIGFFATCTVVSDTIVVVP